jgi:hypothetical protein
LKRRSQPSLHNVIAWGLSILFLLSACQAAVPVVLTPSSTAIPLTEPPVQPASSKTPTKTPEPSAQALATPTIIKPAGTLLVEDTFGDDQLWTGASVYNGNIIVSGDKITLAVKTPKGMLSVPRKEQLPADYYLEVTAEARLCRGEDAFGLMFRAPNDQTGYRFLINCNGMITLQQVVGGTPNPIMDWIQSSSLEPGLLFPVNIGILVSGKTIRIYLNQVQQMDI